MRIEFKDVVVEDYAELYEDDDFIFDEIQDLKARWSIMSYPMMFINANFVGHYSEIQQLLMFGKFEKLLEMNDIKFEHIDAF
jgi:glutaredoxin